jgi:hypothetical protein
MVKIGLTQNQRKEVIFNLLSILLVFVILFTNFSPLLASADSKNIVINLWIGSSVMSVNGLRQPIDSQGTKPIIVEGRTLVPIRAIIEAFGGSISWDATAKKVTIRLNNNTLELWIGQSIASLNGLAMSIDPSNPKVVPMIINGRTMLPLRFVAESLGIDVQYDDKAKMITLTYVSLTVPGTPTLVSPVNGSSINSDNISFSWMPASGADYYKINILNGSTIVYSNDKISSSTYSVSKAAIGEGVFSWRVCACNAAGCSDWSSAYTFTMLPSTLTPPALISPSNNSVLNSGNITFTWSPVYGADLYRIQIMKDGAIIQAIDTITTNSYTIVGVDLQSGLYSWQVGAHNSAGWSTWSTPFYFTLQKQLSVTDIAKFVDRVVYIEVNGYDNGQPFKASGSGFIISSDGKIATNYHVIDKAASGTVTLNDGTKYNIDYVLGYIKPKDFGDKDLAIIKINANNLPICTLGDSDKVQVGEGVVAIGSPLGLPNVVSNGIVSKIWDGGIIQITAPISPGNSGGPLFNMYGEVIGINTFFVNQGQNLNFALPINWLKALNASLSMTLQQVYQKEYGSVPSLPAAPKLISPVDGSVLTTTTPNLVWSSSTGASDYAVIVCENVISKDTLVWSLTTTSTSVIVPSGYLIPGKKYVWTVLSHNSYGYCDSSQVMIWSFTVAQPQLTPPVLLSPKDEKSIIPSLDNYSITFEWFPVNGAVSYVVWIGKGLSGYESTNVYKKQTVNTSLTISTSTLDSGEIYTWAIGAVDSSGHIVWSEDRHFSIAKEKAVMLLSPYDGEHVVIPMLEWYSYPGADSYFVGVIDIAGNIVYSNKTIITLDVVTAGILKWDSKYYWAVYALKDGYIIATSKLGYFYYTLY